MTRVAFLLPITLTECQRWLLGTEFRTSPAWFPKHPNSATSEMNLDFSPGMICKLAPQPPRSATYENAFMRAILKVLVLQD